MLYIAIRQKQYDYVMPGWGTILRNLLSVMRMAKINNSQYKIYWKRNVNKKLPREKNNNINDFVLPDFNIFFKNDIAINNIPTNTTTYSSWKLLVFDEDIDNDDDNNKMIELYINACAYEGGKYNIQKQVPNYTEKIPETIKIKYCKCLNELILSDEIKNDIDLFYEKNFDENTISLILRTWPEDTNRAKMFNLDIITSYINKYHRHNNIFLSVDCNHNSFIEIFKKKCKNYIFYNNMPEDTYKNIYKKALCNMYLAAKTKFIIGSKHSNYPEFCWWLSNCESKLTIL